ncbi:hypothetical protein NECAME_06849, partial [Necator americanus]
MMRRRADAERSPDYSGVISKFERLIHSPDTPRHLSSYYSIKLARFHLKTRNDRRLAEKIIRRALERDRDNIQLLLQLIDIAFTNPDFSQSAVIEAFDFAIKSNIPDAEKLQFSQRKLDFLEDLSYDIDVLQEHQDAHVTLLGELENPPTTTRKRRHDTRTDSKYYGSVVIFDRDHESSRRSSRYSDHRDSRNSYLDSHRGVKDTTGYCVSSNGEIYSSLNPIIQAENTKYEVVTSWRQRRATSSSVIHDNRKGPLLEEGDTEGVGEVDQ